MNIDELKGKPTLTVTEAAEVLGVSRDSAYAAVRTGDIPSLRLGSRIVIPTAKLLDMLGLSQGAIDRGEECEERRTAAPPVMFPLWSSTHPRK